MDDDDPARFRLRSVRPDDAVWIRDASRDLGGPVVAAGCRLHDLTRLAGVLAEPGEPHDASPVGFVVWAPAAAGAVEIVAVKALRRRIGVGSALMAAAEAAAVAAGARAGSLWTTDDNKAAQAFYTACGWRIAEILPGGFADVLRLKGLDPASPVRGCGGRLIRDMIRFEKRLV